MSASTYRLVCRVHRTTGRVTVIPKTLRSLRTANDGVATEESLLRSHAEAVRRARRTAIELIYDYDLTMMYTTTYGREPDSFSEVARDIGRLGRRLRTGGVARHRLVVPELSPRGRWHVHVALREELPRAVVHEAWGHGGVKGPNLKYAYSEEAHEVLASYVTKDFDVTPRGQRRYFAAQGMRPQVTLFNARNEAEAVDLATTLFGAEPRWKNDHGAASVYFFPVPAPESSTASVHSDAAVGDLHLAGRWR